MHVALEPFAHLVRFGHGGRRGNVRITGGARPGRLSPRVQLLGSCAYQPYTCLFRSSGLRSLLVASYVGQSSVW